MNQAQTTTWPRPLDVLQTASSVAAEAALVSGAQVARDARKSVKFKELKAALREAKLPGRSQMRNKAAMLQALDRSGIKTVAGKGIGKAYGAANPVLIGASSLMSASNAYNTARNSGASKGKAITAGAIAASPTAAAVIAPTLLARFAPTAAAGLIRFAPWLLAASAGVSAAREGYKAAQEGKGAGGILGRAALGAADAVSFGLATKAYDAMSAPRPPSQTPPNPNEPVIRMAQAAGQISDAGEEMGKSPYKPHDLQQIEHGRRIDDTRAGPKERATRSRTDKAGDALDSTRYQREVIKGEQAGDPAATVLANENRRSVGEKQARAALDGAPGRVAKAGKFVRAVEDYPNQAFAGRVEDLNTTGELPPDIPGRHRFHQAAGQYEAFGQAGNKIIARRYELGQTGGGIGKQIPGAGTGPQRLSPQDAQRFKDADTQHRQKRSQNIPDPSMHDQSARKPGWGPEARIAAAQARGAKELPYGGDPTKAPDYVQPLSKEKKK